MILYPDQRKDQPENETVVFGAPISTSDWMRMRAWAQLTLHTQMPFVIIEDTPDAQPVGTSVYFMRNESEVNDKVAVLLRDNEDADICLESAAWIRMQENFPGMIYICRASSVIEWMDTMSAVAGAPQESLCMVDFVEVAEQD